MLSRFIAVSTLNELIITEGDETSRSTTSFITSKSKDSHVKSVSIVEGGEGFLRSESLVLPVMRLFLFIVTVPTVQSFLLLQILYFRCRVNLI